MSKKFIYGGSFLSSLPLNTESNAVLAFSVFKLRTAYTGNCIRVRRSGDNAELNIGFDSNNYLDTAALLSFVGANNGFITTWYGQDSVGRNAIQTSLANQPQIVSAGSLLTFNGIAEPLFSGSQTLNIADFSYDFSQLYSLNVSRPADTTNLKLVAGHYLITGNQRSWYFHRYGNTGRANIAISQDGTLTLLRDLTYQSYLANDQYIYDFQYDGSLTEANQVISHRNNILQSATFSGVNVTSLHNSTGSIVIGGSIAGQGMRGGISCFILINGTPTNRSALNTNINTQFNTY